jgi:hypothetical protein
MFFCFQEIPIEIKSDSLEIFEKEDAKFEAILSKVIPKRDVSWHFKENKLGETLKYNQEFEKESNKHILLVRDCVLDDAGEYTISIRNNTHKVNLIVKGKKSVNYFKK